MKFVSTAGGAVADTLSEAMLTGAAADGGLFLPERLPCFAVSDFDGLATLEEVGSKLLAPFFAGDPLEEDLDQICREAFSDIEAPLRAPHPKRPSMWTLELFHGPTAAFKDFGSRFLAAVVDRVSDPNDPYLVLVATSGDTGGAVGQAFQHAKAARAAILFPKGRVSPLQRRQLSCWGPNVATFEVDGDFDACQSLVKQVFRNSQMVEEFNLTSANSINLGRLLPQAIYYATSSLEVFRKTGEVANYIIPSGNMGNAVACVLAREMGLPIGEIVAAVNANKTLSDYFETGKYLPRASKLTLANAMDVGDPSNFARFEALGAKAARDVTSVSVNDEAIRDRIKADHDELDAVLCPHTAVAAEAFVRLPAHKKSKPWLIVATAHPAKFVEVVEDLIGEVVELPASLAAIDPSQCHSTPLHPDVESLRAALNDAFARKYANSERKPVRAWA